VIKCRCIARRGLRHHEQKTGPGCCCYTHRDPPRRRRRCGSWREACWRQDALSR
jgi:hypothetical protein